MLEQQVVETLSYVENADCIFLIKCVIIKFTLVVNEVYVYDTYEECKKNI